MQPEGMKRHSHTLNWWWGSILQLSG